jgi:hypothetical protein
MRVNTPIPNAQVKKFQLKTPTKNQFRHPRIAMHKQTMFAITILLFSFSGSICRKLKSYASSAKLLEKSAAKVYTLQYNYGENYGTKMGFIRDVP